MGINVLSSIDITISLFREVSKTDSDDSVTSCVNTAKADLIISQNTNDL